MEHVTSGYHSAAASGRVCSFPCGKACRAAAGRPNDQGYGPPDPRWGEVAGSGVLSLLGARSGEPGASAAWSRPLPSLLWCYCEPGPCSPACSERRPAAAPVLDHLVAAPRRSARSRHVPGDLASSGPTSAVSSSPGPPGALAAPDRRWFAGSAGFGRGGVIGAEVIRAG